MLVTFRSKAGGNITLFGDAREGLAGRALRDAEAVFEIDGGVAAELARQDALDRTEGTLLADDRS